MAEEQDDKSSKTEEPTEHKLRKLREEGNVPKSREVSSFFMLLGVLLALVLTFPMTMERVAGLVGGTLTEAGTRRLDSQSAVGSLLSFLTVDGIMAMLPTFVLLMLFALAGSFLQTGFLFTFKAIAPKLSRISLIKGFERLFSMRSLMEFLKSVIKLIIVGAVLYMVLFVHREEFPLLQDKSIGHIVTTTQTIIVRMLMGALAITFLLAIIDFLFQKAQFTKEQRMSRRELKEELKDTEGDPFIKGRQRQIRQERARARMMQEVPKADVVITNPTHFSVALRYDDSQEAAPRVVAKGADHVALKIREIAEEHGVPLYEDPPLARQLFRDVELDEEIPLELYETVAKVIAYVYNLKKAA